MTSQTTFKPLTLAKLRAQSGFQDSGASARAIKFDERFTPVLNEVLSSLYEAQANEPGFKGIRVTAEDFASVTLFEDHDLAEAPFVVSDAVVLGYVAIQIRKSFTKFRLSGWRPKFESDDSGDVFVFTTNDLLGEK